MNMRRILLGTAMLLLAGNVNAAEWDFGVGVSYVTGISDVVDLYEDNFEIEESSDVETFTIPIGASFIARYQADSGITFNIGVGPAFLIAGDVEHTEIPLSATIGYMFSRDGAEAGLRRRPGRWPYSQSRYLSRSPFTPSSPCRCCCDSSAA